MNINLLYPFKYVSVRNSKKKYMKPENRVNDVIEICRDGADGYHRAAEKVDNPEIKTIFNRLSQQRKGFVEELVNESRKLGYEPSETGTVKGFFHRNWLDLKGSVSGHSIEAVVKTARTGEKEAIETYNEALDDKEIPTFLREKLREQHDLIQGALTQLGEFERNE